ncbi:unnamed protein product [Caenorhabditis sp. 36 PRJEB53466]|nr:unnamed protein product [Caenorhabditis sp. 36 PRJEB53466]
MTTYTKMKEFSSSPIRRYGLYHVVLFVFIVFIIATLMNRPEKVLAVSEQERIGVAESVEPPQNVWDTLDGQGYQFDQNRDNVLDPRFEVLNSLPACDLTVDKQSPSLDPTKLMNAFQKCINPIVGRWKNDVAAINGRWEETERCDRVFRSLRIVPMENLHEIKWTILPVCKEDNIMVTLGVGHDTMAEEKLNKTLPNTKFFGADPIIDPNRQLYSAFGKFFPFAIGKEPGFTKFRVLPNQNQKTREYQFQDVTTLPFSYFLSDILGLKKIDVAWIDIEGGEFEFLEQLHRGEMLDQKGVSICQFNLEIHSKFRPSGAPVFHDFVFRVLKEKRYVFLKPARTEPGVHRMFFVNLEDKQCIRKFLQ